MVYVYGHFVFQLQDIVQTGLEGNEYVTLLSWILNTYPGPELMASPKVNVDVSKLPPLLSDDIMQKLQDEYLQVQLSYCHPEMHVVTIELSWSHFAILASVSRAMRR